MPAKPSGSMILSPGLNEGQGDTICQRCDHYSYRALERLERNPALTHLTDKQRCEVLTDMLEVFLYAAIPEHFGGDENVVRAECKKWQANRPMPNGYRLPDHVADANALVKGSNPFEEKEPLR